MGTVDDLILLAEILQAGSLSAASRKTGIAKSTLSRRMDDLEKSLGVRLIHRNPRRFSATEIGNSLRERGLKIKGELGEVTRIVEGHTRHPAGSLRITCPAILADLHLSDFAILFSQQHPDVRLTLDVSAGSFSARMEHYDIAIQPAREDYLADSELVRRKLIVAEYALVAAPGFLAGLGGEKATLEAFNGCAAIGWAADGFGSSWKLTNRMHKTGHLDVRIVFSSNNLAVIQRAAVSGLGLARLPIALCESALEAGRLELPLPNWTPPSVTIYALYSSRHSLTLAGNLFVTKLTRFLKERLAAS